MKLVTVWIVCNPKSRSTLADVCWEQEIARLDRYILGSPSGAWTEENHTVYVSREEAVTDAHARMARIAKDKR